MMHETHKLKLGGKHKIPNRFFYIYFLFTRTIIYILSFTINFFPSVWIKNLVSTFLSAEENYLSNEYIVYCRFLFHIPFSYLMHLLLAILIRPTIYLFDFIVNTRAF